MRVGQVDALRGLAALLVALFYHNFYLGGQAIYTGPLDSLQPFHWLYAWGWTLVDLFFVISGFIFAHVYLTDDGSLKPNVTVRDFAVARFARLYPLHFVTLLICALLVVSSRVWGAADYPESSVPVFLENLFFFQVLHGGFNSASWSLSVEAVCYALFILLARANLLRRYAPLLILCGVCLCFPDELPNRIGRGLIGFFLGFELWRFREAKVPAPVLAVVALIGLLLPVHMWHFKYHVMLDFTLWPAVLLLALKLRATYGAPLARGPKLLNLPGPHAGLLRGPHCHAWQADSCFAAAPGHVARWSDDPVAVGPQLSLVRNSRTPIFASCAARPPNRRTGLSSPFRCGLGLGMQATGSLSQGAWP